MVHVARDLSLQVAVMVSKSDVLDDVAKEVLAAAKTEAAKHNRSHEFEGSFAIVKDANPSAKGVVDRLVVNNDPMARFIEFGHLFVGFGKGALTGGGSILRWVEGLHVLRNAGLAVAAKHGWTGRASK
jgi:hypothetical protein